MTKEEHVTSFISIVYCNMHENTKILLIPVNYLIYPGPSTVSG